MRRVLACFCLLVLLASSASAKVKENEKVVNSLQNKPSRKEWSFAVLGDNRFSCGICDWMFEKVLTSMSQDSFDFAVNTGDFTNTGTKKEYQGYLDRIRLLKFPTINVLGNHDVTRSNSKGTKYFRKYFGRPYFYFDYQNARFIILNNAHHEFGDKQRTWLEKTLTGAKDRLKFVFMHIPTFNPSRRRAYLIKWDEDKNLFEEIIRRHKVDILFTGHMHLFHDTVYKGVRTIITGGGGAPLYEVTEKGGFYHWIKVQVKGKTVQAKVIKVPFPFWSRLLYRIVYFFNYNVRDNWKVYAPVFLVVFFLLSGILLKIRRKNGDGTGTS